MVSVCSELGGSQREFPIFNINIYLYNNMGSGVPHNSGSSSDKLMEID